jgi:hypothetical protein
MSLFLLYCVLSGLLLGCCVSSVFLIILTSLQLTALACFLWIVDMIGRGEMLVWTLLGLFTHQGAYLCGAYARLWLTVYIDSRPQRFDASAFDAEQTSADLSATGAKMRNALIGQTRRASGATSRVRIHDNQRRRA